MKMFLRISRVLLNYKWEKFSRVGWRDSRDIVCWGERKIFMRCFIFCFVSKVSSTKTVEMIKVETRLLLGAGETVVFCMLSWVPNYNSHLTNCLCIFWECVALNIFWWMPWCLHLFWQASSSCNEANMIHCSLPLSAQTIYLQKIKCVSRQLFVGTKNGQEPRERWVRRLILQRDLALRIAERWKWH